MNVQLIKWILGCCAALVIVAVVAVVVAVVAAPPSTATAQAPARASAALHASAPASRPDPATDTKAARAAAVERDGAEAERLLAKYTRTYRLLDGATVHMGTTPKGEEAISYYQDGEIVVSTEHTVEMQKILAHEIWHVIDWRDNGRLDWGEDLPPGNASGYLR